MKNLVLLGGGHSHAIVLHRLSRHPLPGVRLTLITPEAYAPYSGMLPGHLGGQYTFEESHINLKTLAQAAQAHLILDQAIGLDLIHNLVLCQDSLPISFDWLSINIGSTPAQLGIPGAAAYAIPVKPVSQVLAGWHGLLQTLAQGELGDPPTLGIVGGGAGGIELAFTMQARLKAFSVKIHLFDRHQHLMNQAPAALGYRLQALLTDCGVQLHLGETVTAVTLDQDAQKVVQCQSGLRVKCDHIFWLTQAVAPPWVTASNLATDEQGFIQVKDTLQSVSHSHVFATGDIATMVNHPRPKAGIFAVRQGKPLFDNLQRIVTHQPLRLFYPQKRYLSLMGTGNQQAIALWDGFWAGPSPWLWWWKDKIDRQFMAQFAPSSQRMMTP